jgi:hypothetical protein
MLKPFSIMQYTPGNTSGKGIAPVVYHLRPVGVYRDAIISHVGRLSTFVLQPSPRKYYRVFDSRQKMRQFFTCCTNAPAIAMRFPLRMERKLEK